MIYGFDRAIAASIKCTPLPLDPYTMNHWHVTACVCVCVCVYVLYMCDRLCDLHMYVYLYT